MAKKKCAPKDKKVEANFKTGVWVGGKKKAIHNKKPIHIMPDSSEFEIGIAE